MTQLSSGWKRHIFHSLAWFLPRFCYWSLTTAETLTENGHFPLSLLESLLNSGLFFSGGKNCWSTSRSLGHSWHLQYFGACPKAMQRSDIPEGGRASKWFLHSLEKSLLNTVAEGFKSELRKVISAQTYKPSPRFHPKIEVSLVSDFLGQSIRLIFSPL